MDYYRQCTLRRPTENGDIIEVAYLPKKFAKKGKIVRLKHNGSWTDGWQVCKASNSLVVADQIHRDEYRKHRTRTDI